MTVVRPYMSKKDLGLSLNLSQPTINSLVDGMRKEIIAGRYSQYVIAGKRISFYAMIDYLTHKDALNDSLMRKKVPEFDPISIARLCGQEGMFL